MHLMLTYQLYPSGRQVVVHPLVNLRCRNDYVYFTSVTHIGLVLHREVAVVNDNHNNGNGLE